MVQAITVLTVLKMLTNGKLLIYYTLWLFIALLFYRRVFRFSVRRIALCHGRRIKQNKINSPKFYLIC